MTHIGGRLPEEPTTDSVLGNMLGRAIGMDNPMSDEALAAGREIVQARLDRAAEIVRGAPLGPDEEYDTEAVAALLLIGEERDAAESR